MNPKKELLWGLWVRVECGTEFWRAFNRTSKVDNSPWEAGLKERVLMHVCAYM